MSEHILEVKDLKQYFPVSTGWFKKTPLKAVDGVSFTIDKGETLGLVGESGCGKTTVGRTILHLYTPTSGDVIYDGTKITPHNVEHYRKDMQIVFQDPYSSLNPRMTVADIVGEPLDIHHLCKNSHERAERISELLTLVGLNSAPLCARVFRRSASAHRHCARACRIAQVHRVRRASIGAGRVDSGTDNQYV